MGIASSLKKVSNKTIMKFGGDITIRRTTQSQYNLEKGENIKIFTDTTIKGFLESVSSSEVNDLISQSDKKVIASGQDLTFVPTTKDKIIISSIEYQIIRIEVDTAENVNVNYIFYLRG